MTSASYQKKQISFPQFFSRMISLLMDLVILSIIVTPIMKYITVFVFNFNFNDFLIENNLRFDSYLDFPVILSNESFGQYMTYSKFCVFYTEILLIQFVISAPYFIFFWTKFGTTPSKLFFKIKIVDYETHKNPTLRQSCIRYIAYILIPISIFYILFSKNSRALHDNIAGTIAIKT